jgi:hypothetical protein
VFVGVLPILAVASALLHPYALTGHNNEIDGFVRYADLLRGGGLPYDPFRPLLYPILVAALSVLLPTFAAARLVSTAATACLVATTFHLADRLAGRRLAWLAAGLTLLNAHVLIEGMLATSDMLFSALALLTVALAIRTAHRPGRGSTLLLAAAFAATWFTRYQAVALLPSVLLAFALQRDRSLVERGRQLALWLGAALVFSIPNLVLNARQFGNPLHNENWKNLPLKLYADGDWSYLERTPFDGWWSVLSGDPGLVLQRTLADLASIFPQTSVYLLGEGAAGVVLSSLAALGLVLLALRPDRLRWFAPVVAFLVFTVLGVCFSFFPFPRLLLSLIPVAIILALVALFGLLRDQPRAALVVSAVLGAGLAHNTTASLSAFVAHHPSAEVAAARALVDEVGADVTIAAGFHAMGAELDNEVVFLRNPSGSEHGDPVEYYGNVAPLLAEAGARFLVISRQTLAQRPPSLIEGEGLPDYLVPYDATGDVRIYRIELTPDSLAALGCPRPGEDASPELDDFEDRDTAATCTGERQGRWVSYDDGTAGRVQLEPVAGGGAGSAWSLGLHSSGFSDWGAGAGLLLLQRDLIPPRAPYDASAYDALQFHARADAELDLTVKLADQWSYPEGLRCDPAADCHDDFAATVRVGTRWEPHTIPFDSLHQGGWGLPSLGSDGFEGGGDDGLLDASTLFALYFQVGPGEHRLRLDELRLRPVGEGTDPGEHQGR